MGTHVNGMTAFCAIRPHVSSSGVRIGEMVYGDTAPLGETTALRRNISLGATEG
jgi:hypothetical protein